MNYFDEIFVKCPHCHTENIMFPRNNKYIKCYKCGFKIKDKEYMEYIKKIKKNRRTNENSNRL